MRLGGQGRTRSRGIAPEKWAVERALYSRGGAGIIARPSKARALRRQVDAGQETRAEAR